MAAAVLAVGALTACAEADDAAEDAAEQATTATSAPATSDGDDEPSASADEVTIGRDQEHDVTSTEAARVHCDGGGEVYVRAATSVVVTGSCEDVDIPIDGATVDIESADEVSVEGDENEVAIEQTREIDVEGSRNTVTYGGDPEVDVTGSDNHVAAS